MKNYYQILGVDRYSNIQEINRNYRKLATKFHPDKNNGDAFFENMFKEILEAHEVLSDNLKKTKYDIQYDNTFGTKKRETINAQTDFGYKENKSNLYQKAYPENQHVNNQNSTSAKKKKNYSIFFIGLMIIGILKLAFWIKEETYKNKNVTPQTTESIKKTSEKKIFENMTNAKIDKNAHLNENNYTYFKDDNFKIISDYKFKFSKEASDAANEISVFPTNSYIYDYFDDNTMESFTQYIIQVMDINSIFKGYSKSMQKEISEKYFNSVKINISVIDKNYIEVKKDGIILIEYSYMGGTVDTHIPAKCTFFIKNKKAYTLSVMSKNKLNIKNDKFKKAFEFIEE